MTRTRRRAIAAAGAALVAVALALAVLLATDEGARSPGPLKTDVTDAVSDGQEAGEPFTFGLAVAYNRGDEPAVLERISLIDPSPGLETFATRVGGPERRIMFQATDNWPTEAITDQRPVRDFEVAPASTPAGGRGVELVFALRAARPGRYNIRGVQVDYRVGDTAHRAKLDVGLQMCVTPRGEPTSRRCPLPSQ